MLAGLVALKLDVALAGPLLRYLGELVQWNKAYNLTAVRDPAEMVTRHFLDSLVVSPFMAGRVLDIGSGAGFPGIPLALANPALQVTVLDSNGKKARFLRHAKRALALGNVEVQESRAEAYRPELRFDTVTSRAFGTLAEFCRLAGHLMVPGGRLVAMKGKLAAKELSDLPDGFEIQDSHPLQVPGLNEERHAIVITQP